MKKLIFLFAMMLTASMVMAQKTATIWQTGSSNHADITQLSTAPGLFGTLGDANNIYAYQSGTSNELTTAQTGQDNYIRLDQSGSSNKATMDQFTCDVTVGGDNNAEIYQSNNFNSATLTQREKVGGSIFNPDKSHNTATAIQSGYKGTYVLNQGSDEIAPTNVQTLTQSGNENNADINQLGFTNWSSINQSGYKNVATLDQALALYVPASWNKSYSWQSSQSNDLTIIQLGFEGLQRAESYQKGVGVANTTNIKQVGAGPEEVYSEQNGVNDIIHVSQTY